MLSESRRGNKGKTISNSNTSNTKDDSEQAYLLEMGALNKLNEVSLLNVGLCKISEKDNESHSDVNTTQEVNRNSFSISSPTFRLNTEYS